MRNKIKTIIAFALLTAVCLAAIILDANDRPTDVYPMGSSITFGADSTDPYELGFCLTGLIYLLMLFVPNIIWARGRKPQGYEQAEKQENRVLAAFERAGQAIATVAVLIFPAINPRIVRLPEGIYFRWNLLILAAAFVLMLLYECYWIKYFRSPRTMKDMYSSFAGFPLAGATLPVLALLLMGIYSRNLIVVAAAVILGIGHIGIHLMHSHFFCEQKRITIR